MRFLCSVCAEISGGTHYHSLHLRLPRKRILRLVHPPLPEHATSTCRSTCLSFREYTVRHPIVLLSRSDPLTRRIIHRYLLGSGGTLMFDVTIVSQFALYRRKASPRERGRRTSVSRHMAEEEGLLGEDVEEGTTTPQRRRHPVEDRTYSED